MGDYAHALEPAQSAWEMARQSFGTEHLQTHLEAVAYGAILDGLGRYAECERLYRHALAVMLRELGPAHYEVAMLEHNLAAVLAVQGHVGEAERLYRSALRLKDLLLGDRSTDAAATRICLAGVLNSLGQYDEACALLQHAQCSLEPQLEANHPYWSVLNRHLMTALNGASSNTSTT